MSSNVYLSDFGKFYEVLNIFSRWIRAPIVTVNERVIEVCWNIEAVRGYKDTVIIGEGLSEGAFIVKSPLSSPMDGMRVRVKTEN